MKFLNIAVCDENPGITIYIYKFIYSYLKQKKSVNLRFNGFTPGSPWKQMKALLHQRICAELLK